MKFSLLSTENGQALSHPDYSKPLTIDFASEKMQWRQKTSGKNQPLAKAVGIKKDYFPSILDVTAGLGKDGFLLADLGCQVTLLERSEILYKLLQDGLTRASEHPHLTETIARMKLMHNDSIEYLKNSSETFDVIYCDPMFPETKKTALVKKEMQILQKIIGDDADADELFLLAHQKAKRVVVKRHRLAPHLAALKPSFEIKGKTTRFDVYLT